MKDFAATDGGHPAARDALLLEVILHGICAVLRKDLVVGIGANVVSPALQDNALVRVGLDHSTAVFVQDALGLVVKSIGQRQSVRRAGR